MRVSAGVDDRELMMERVGTSRVPMRLMTIGMIYSWVPCEWERSELVKGCNCAW
jgi:hypothetical protein